MKEHILLVNKPKGITSARLVDEVKKKLKVRKAGHAGTLDPLATGLMIVGIEEGTKKLAEYLKLPKSYRAEILLGERRTTGDMEGEILEEALVSNLEERNVKEALHSMRGRLELPVPLYSAIKRGGEPLYKKMRRGEKVEALTRSMIVNETHFLALILESKRAIVSAEFDVESGVYIRSLAEELGKRLGYPATLKELCRTRIGSFKLEDAKKLEDL